MPPQSLRRTQTSRVAHAVQSQSRWGRRGPVLRGGGGWGEVAEAKAGSAEAGQGLTHLRECPWCQCRASCCCEGKHRRQSELRQGQCVAGRPIEHARGPGMPHRASWAIGLRLAELCLRGDARRSRWQGCSVGCGNGWRIQWARGSGVLAIAIVLLGSPARPHPRQECGNVPFSQVLALRPGAKGLSPLLVKRSF